ncbi:uncharacterized protein LOC130207340 [Pseudoliparis swirei]|uniref:uncharacterized protein LOC130207340 n=1 Tax=Pseudoliparis swirei TaxID=2059687 RepID=UPI0024BDF893|nr:uncharacterized protein LOC130207340 [Pseudoliparis swirei]
MVTGLSDHNLTLVARKLTSKRFRPLVREDESFRIPKRNLDIFHHTIQLIDWDDLLLGIDIEEDSKAFSDKLENTMKDFSCKFRHKHIKHSVPWMNDDILKIMKERDSALKTAIKNKSSHDRQHFAMLRNRVVMKLRKAKADFFMTVIEKARGKTKMVWDQLHKLMGHPNKVRKLQELNINGKLSNNPVEIAKAFNHYFIDSVATIAKCFSPEIRPVCTVNTLEPTFIIRNVTHSDVTRIISFLKPSKTKDTFGMDAVMLKTLSKTLINPISNIINLSISQNMFPSVWKSAAVIPVFKEGDRLSTSNYRPISILPTISKVAEKLVAEQMICHLKNSPFAQISTGQRGCCWSCVS